MQGLFDWQNERNALESQSNRWRYCVISLARVFHLKPRFTNRKHAEVSRDTGTLIPQILLLWCAARRCAWRKPERLIVHCGRPMESESAPSKRSDPSIDLPRLSLGYGNCLSRPTAAMVMDRTEVGRER